MPRVPQTYDVEMYEILHSISNKMDRRPYVPLEPGQYEKAVRAGYVKGVSHRVKFTDAGRRVLHDLSRSHREWELAEGDAADSEGDMTHTANPRGRTRGVSHVNVTVDDIRARAESAGLAVETYAPGDGVRRFQFMLPRRGAGPGVFERRLYTASGIGEALVWIEGFDEGYKLAQQGHISGLRRNPPRHRGNPGKFDSDLDAAMYRLSMDGTQDDISHQDNWYGRLDAVTFDEVVQAFVDDGEDEHSARKAWQKELKGKIRGDMIPIVIIHEDHNGLTTVRYFASDRDGEKYWQQIQQDIAEEVEEQED